MSLTPEQRAAVHAEDPSVAVVAGAGTGKTRVLTERYIRLVAGGTDMARILAVTFTEKAAREMKDRIRDALPRDRAQDVEFAPISTIHAFLARLLRERALDAHVDPRFLVADELTSDLLLEDALAETVAEMDVDTLVELRGAEWALRELYNAARATPHEMKDLRWYEPDIDELVRDTAAFVDECEVTTASAPGTRGKLAAIAQLAPRLRAGDLTVAQEFYDAVKGNVAPAQRDLFRHGRTITARWRPLQYLDRTREVGAAIVDALDRIDRRYTAKKEADGLLDFSDLERFGLRLLRRDDLVLDYEHLLVDEYQDVNRIQEAILDRLAERCTRFGVGDQKQSIYRFRYADARVFADLQRTAKPYLLTGSFRSRPELLSFHNRLFRDVFAGGDVEPQDLNPEATWRPKERKSVELLTVEGEQAAEARRREADVLARRLHDIVEEEQLRITNEEAEDAPLRYGDCAILLRAMSNLGVYERALTQAGVPYVVVMGRGYYAAREVVELAFLLSLLHDPYDRYRAIGVMTSLLCGVPETDIYRLPQSGVLATAALRMNRPDEIPPDRWERLVTFANRFERWQDMAMRVDTGDLIEDIFLKTGFPELMLLELDGRRRHANLMKALRRARRGISDPATYARELLEFRERELRESEAPIAAETDNAVKIMTVHAAKGLEFPLVALADLTWQRTGGSGPILRADGRFGFAFRDRKVLMPGRDELKAWNKGQEEDEQRRLLYVALTRAEEHLILSAALHEHNADRTLVDRLLENPPPELEVTRVTAAPERRRRGAAVSAALRRGAPMPSKLERDPAGADELLARIDAVKLPVANSSPYVAAVKDLVEFTRCPRRYRLGRMLGVEIEEVAEGRERSDADEHPRRRLGNVFHAVMEDIGPGAVADEAKVKEHLPEATDRDVAKIVGWCEWLAEQEVIRGVRGPQHREMNFLAKVAGLGMRGVIDLFVPDVPLLLDYKTSVRVREGEFSVQVSVYAMALEQLGYRVPEVVHLAYVDAKRMVEVARQPVDALVRRFRSAHRGPGSFPPEPSEACTHCDFRRACLHDGVKCPGSPLLF